MEKNNLIFISGGARSGKSSFAERCAAEQSRAADRPLYYLATSRRVDGEMSTRIDRHRHDRERSGVRWRTLECPEDIGSSIRHIEAGSVVLLDCLTLLLTNELFREHDKWQDKLYQTQVFNRIASGIEDIRTHVHTLVIVSNDVSYGGHSSYDISNIYARILGQLHQHMVKVSTEAYAVESGVPLLMKGTLGNGS
ncbi:bifunctional adenosylcobinamide kinase/adenosylcobinamide-phosphate guanylyltransferase [Lentibacillus saliphilus]|uniref:bifunctional adenosylcobinamide kinase/adenosylcobinamide-phosphate guanylyltransferase n=1 Tax=Lentibacillus saliphilus TaxID=2737028 RepID=UPI001C3043D1|nr:bifunctional adenosylcobinamide kinase/adenosylcobinamide-phosphate guanylyltransferase [Lentibacillus saliphilus]